MKYSIVNLEHLTFLERLEFCFNIIFCKNGIFRDSNFIKCIQTVTQSQGTTTLVQNGITPTFTVTVPNGTNTGTQLLEVSTKNMNINQEELDRLYDLESKWKLILEEDDQDSDDGELSIQDLEAIAEDETLEPLVRQLASTAAFHKTKSIALSKMLFN